MTKSVVQNSSLFEVDDGNRFHWSEVSDPGFCVVFVARSCYNARCNVFV